MKINIKRPSAIFHNPLSSGACKPEMAFSHTVKLQLVSLNTAQGNPASGEVPLLKEHTEAFNMFFVFKPDIKCKHNQNFSIINNLTLV